MKVDNTLYNYNMLSWRYLSNWPHNIKQFFLNRKYIKQRAIRGWSDVDIQRLDTYIINLLAGALFALGKRIKADDSLSDDLKQERLDDLWSAHNKLLESIKTQPNEYAQDAVLMAAKFKALKDKNPNADADWDFDLANKFNEKEAEIRESIKQNRIEGLMGLIKFFSTL